MEGFLKKLSETAKSTVSTINEKSSELVTAGKIKLEINKLESTIKNKKFEIGETIFTLFSSTNEMDLRTVEALCQEIKELEAKIEGLKELSKKSE